METTIIDAPVCHHEWSEKKICVLINVEKHGVNTYGVPCIVGTELIPCPAKVCSKCGGLFIPEAIKDK